MATELTSTVPPEAALPMTSPDVILRTEKITKAYPGTMALKGVDFNVYRGKVNVLVGENGAGKSTLIKIISGVYAPTSGSVLLDGKECRFHNPRQALDRGIVVIHQELSIANDLTVAEKIGRAHV